MLRIIAALVCFSLSTASIATPEDTGHPKLTGVYQIYSGGLADSGPPTSKDAKIMFAIDGKAARQMFDAIGPDVKDLCTEGSGTRVRKKDNEKLTCSRSTKGEYFCNFGFDLKSGKSIGGIVC